MIPIIQIGKFKPEVILIMRQSDLVLIPQAIVVITETFIIDIHCGEHNLFGTIQIR
ncbi:hypothetical protein D3C81_790720 [compost metagenome]